MVRLAFCLAMCGAAVLVALSRGAEPARACSIAVFTTQFLDQTIEASSVVAVGTLDDRNGNAITLVVEEGLKGASAGDRLTINNATNLDCYEAIEPGRQNYEQGARVLVFLEPDTHGVAEYKVQRFGWDVFEVEGDVLHPYVNDWVQPISRIDDVRAHFEALRNTPYVPGLEEVGPCNQPWGFRPEDTGNASQMAEAIVIGTTAGNRDGATVIRVDEVFKGEVPAEFTLNDHVLYHGSPTECRPTLEAQRNYLPEGTRVALFLVRDDYGIAEWRPAVWGAAYWRINDLPEDRYEYIPLLSEVRAAAPGPAAQPATSPTIRASQPVTSPGVDGNDDSDWLPWLVTGLIAAVFVGGATALALRRR